MAISYPLSFPNNTSIRSIDLTTRNAIAVSRSPFTYAEQIHSYSGQQWEAVVTLLWCAQTEAWLSFLLAFAGNTAPLLGDHGIPCSLLRHLAAQQLQDRLGAVRFR